MSRTLQANPREMSTNIYVLKLEDRCFYVGKTQDVAARYQEHLNGSGSAWTKLHPPISIEIVYENANPFDEDRVTKELMSIHGIDKVRGGTYVMRELPEQDRIHLEKELWAVKDCCTKCGRKGHFVARCYAKTTVNGREIKKEEPEEKKPATRRVKKEEPEEKNPATRRVKKEEPEEAPQEEKVKKVSTCKNCGNPGHTKSKCFSKTTVDGDPITEEKHCSKCGRTGHFKTQCYAKTTVAGHGEIAQPAEKQVDLVNLVEGFVDFLKTL